MLLEHLYQLPVHCHSLVIFSAFSLGQELFSFAVYGWMLAEIFGQFFPSQIDNCCTLTGDPGASISVVCTPPFFGDPLAGFLLTWSSPSLQPMDGWMLTEIFGQILSPLN